jgi:frataxin-like iron-binding protein CyaY
MNFINDTHLFLEDLAEKIEKLDSESKLDIDYQDGILKITIINSKKTFIINRNSGNQKIWYSSPFSGADYFSFDKIEKKWKNNLDTEITKKLLTELNIY